MDIKLHKNDLPDDLDLGNLIAVDGEFMGLNIRRDPLCLIQISSGKSDAHIIQLDRLNYKAPNLINVLRNDKVTKIFHYGRADLAFIKFYLKTETNNILDTKIASKLSRSYSDNHSLKTLIKEFINVDISKQFQSSDFGGELTSAQLKYCSLPDSDRKVCQRTEKPLASAAREAVLLQGRPTETLVWGLFLGLPRPHSLKGQAAHAVSKKASDQNA